ncbi:hypothetical protein SO802_006000 [Lithocarpus litseifolius]|uniref:Uncharacterized protein n=1 Tax=Lithocarpus litseifolius TaxID=425828 RepID=A0AAW2DM79_9ROSI
MVTVYVGLDTCIRIKVRNDGRMMNCNFIASNILKKLCEDHTTPIKHLRSRIELKYEGHKPSYYKVWDAKQKLIEKIFGNWEESYQRLQKLLMEYIYQDPTTQVFYRTTHTGEDDTVFLHYVFWSFGPCIDGFKYCKPVISIDGTYLYGKYQGKLLVAMATDANDKVVKFDTIMESIKQVKIEAIRNKKKVTGKDGKEKNQDYLPYTYLINEYVDMWTQSHDGRRRFGAMTTNILECFNGVLKGARRLPIATMVEFTWSKLVGYFHDWHKEITRELLEGKKWSTHAFSTWEENRRKFEKHYLKAFSN